MSRTLTLIATLVIVTLAALAGGTGCSPRRSRAEEAHGFEQQRVDSILILVIDLSGSFMELFKPDGKASAHLLEAIQNYFQARVGRSTNDRLIIAQISGAQQPIVFEGSPADLRANAYIRKEWLEV